MQPKDFRLLCHLLRQLLSEATDRDIIRNAKGLLMKLLDI